MTTRTKSDSCPLCGSQKKPKMARMTRSQTKSSSGIAALFKPSREETELLPPESSDDRTANDFAARLLEAQKARNDI